MDKKSVAIILIVSIIVIFVLALSGKDNKSVPANPSPAQISSESSTSVNNSGEQKMVDTSSKLPEMQIDKTKLYTAVLTTSKGVIKIQLNAAQTPITVNNFVALSKKGFYNDTVFHRVINGFMIQGGDPQGNGTGGPGYEFNDEPFTGEYSRGTVAMANAGPNTNGSQFFIMHKDALTMPKLYVIFGKVVEGMDVVDAIATTPVKRSPMGENSSPVEPIKVLSVSIEEK